MWSYLQKKWTPKILILFSMILFGTMFGSTSTLASNTPDLALSPEYTSAQRVKNGIFDLKVTPKSEETITLKIANLSKNEQKVKIVPTTAYTSDAGTIALDRVQVPEEKSLKYSFYDLVDKKDRTKTVTIPANKIEKVSFTIHVPKNKFKGVIAGGLHVENITAQDPLNKKGVSLKNQYAYSIAVILKESEKKAKPDLKLGKIKPGKVGTDIKVKSQVINFKPAVISDMSVTTNIKSLDGKTDFGKTKSTGLSMAPNSNFSFQNNWKNKQIRPGKYRLNMIAKTQSGQKWRLSKVFEISIVDAAIANDQYNPWIKYIIVAVLLLILIGITWYIINKKKKSIRE